MWNNFLFLAHHQIIFKFQTTQSIPILLLFIYEISFVIDRGFLLYKKIKFESKYKNKKTKTKQNY